MKISIIAVGKIKEKYLKDGILEYKKRLSRFTKLEIIEVKDESLDEKTTTKDKVKEIETDRILKKINKSSYIILLDIHGKKLDSISFSKEINKQLILGVSNITFIIGGSIGVSKNVLDICTTRISISDLTFPHQLVRLILLEQIYRAFKIIKNETYHK
ncbi:MAG: 23S rRNA (pseudouridine(1915)-N(3))-methyltransferase RlmH [Clostridiales bacterium]